MELKNFVMETLKEIMEGIVEAQKIDQVGLHIATPSVVGSDLPVNSGIIGKGTYIGTSVKFDVAVTVESTDSSKSGGGIKIAIFNAGLSGESETKNTAISRIQFAVPIGFPRHQ